MGRKVQDSWTWTTFKGEKADLDSIDHQHFSNVYWYNLIVNGENLKDHAPFREALARRFDGELLEYRPPHDFGYEVNYLKKNGHFKRDPEDESTVRIIYNGKIVGTLL